MRVAVILCALLLEGQDTGLAPETLLLARIKVRAAENLNRLPNYTCQQTIERSRRRANGRRFELLDLVRLEVAMVNNREMFAWPGSDKFDEREITDMVSGGTIGNGSFGLHARSVFLGGAAMFTPQGERIRDGRKTTRYDFRVPLMLSGYKMRVPPREAIVGYEGSFWVDAETLDLAWLEVRITEIPPEIPIASGLLNMAYASTRIGERNFLLPQSSELVLVDLGGNESRNVTRFSGCKQYSGESVISFEDAPATDAVEAEKPRQQITLPADLELDLRLETPIEAGVSAVGDAMKARVARDVKRKGAVIVPKGAVVTGRLLRLQRLAGRNLSYWEAGLDLTRIEFGAQFAEFNGRMTELPPTMSKDIRWTPPQRPVSDLHIGILYIKGDTGRIARGTSMSWRTVAPK